MGLHVEFKSMAYMFDVRIQRLETRQVDHGRVGLFSPNNGSFGEPRKILIGVRGGRGWVDDGRA